METLDKKKSDLIFHILIALDNKSFNVFDLWINNSDDNEGEDIEVNRITPHGLEMADGDTWRYEELSIEELERVHEVIIND